MGPTDEGWWLALASRLLQTSIESDYLLLSMYLTLKKAKLN